MLIARIKTACACPLAIVLCAANAFKQPARIFEKSQSTWGWSIKHATEVIETYVALHPDRAENLGRKIARLAAKKNRPDWEQKCKLDCKPAIFRHGPAGGII